MTIGAVPTDIGGYEVLGVLGKGAFGTVFRVRGAQGETLALKWLVEIDPESRIQRLRFEREVEIASALSHPNIVRVLGWGNERGVPYSVMELVEGPTLRAVIRQRPAGPATDEWYRRVHELGSPLFGALQYLHNHHILHRDLKPENVIVEKERGPRVADFGLALSQSAEVTRSAIGVAVGTIVYMAPELFSGAEADRRSDIYALGTLLYELISGQLPHPLDDEMPAAGAILQIVTQKGRPLRAVEPNASAELEAVLERMMAPQREDRWFTVADAWYAWLQAIEKLLEEDLPSGSLTVEPTACEPIEPALCGRDVEMHELEAALLAVRRGEGARIAGVLGAPGLGRSRLLAEWPRRHAKDSLVLHVRPVPGMVGTACLHSLQECVRLATEDADARGVVQAFVERKGDGEAGDKLRLFESIARLLHVLQGTQPIVLAVDDLHLIDTLSVELLDYLTRRWLRSAGAPPRTLILFTAAEVPAGSPAARWLEMLRGYPTRVTLLELSPLQTDAMETMVARALGLGPNADRLPPGLVATLGTATDGNPQLIMEWLRLWLREGRLSCVHGAWLWSGSETAALPQGQRLMATVRQRLARLDEAQSRVLAAAAVTGDGFDFDELLAMELVTERELVDALDRLVAAGLLTEQVAGASVVYAVASAQVRSVVLADGSATRRLALHRSWSRVLRGRVGQGAPSDTVLFRLIDHCEATADWEPARQLLEQAAARATAAYAHDRALALYRRLLSLESRAELSPRLWLSAATAAWKGGEMEQSKEICNRLLATVSQDRQLRCDVYHLLAHLATSEGDFDRGTDCWMDVLRTQGWSPPRPAPSSGFRKVSSFLRGRHVPPSLPVTSLEQANFISDVAVQIFRASSISGDPTRQTQVAYVSGVVEQLSRLDHPDLKLRHLVLAAFATTQRGPLHYETTRAAAQRALDGARRDPDPQHQIEAYQGLGYLLMAIGALDEAEELAQHSLDLSRRLANFYYVAWHLTLVVHCKLARGDLAAVNAAAHELVEVSQSLGMPHMTALGYLQLADAAARVDDATTAAECQARSRAIGVANNQLRLSAALGEGLLRLRHGHAEVEKTLHTAWEAAHTRAFGALWIALSGRLLAVASAARRTVQRDVRRAIGDSPGFQGLLQGIEAACLEAEGHAEAAATTWDAALAHHRAMQARGWLAWDLEHSAAFLARCGDAPAAAARLEEARRLWKVMASEQGEAPSSLNHGRSGGGTQGGLDAAPDAVASEQRQI